MFWLIKIVPQNLRLCHERPIVQWILPLLLGRGGGRAWPRQTPPPPCHHPREERIGSGPELGYYDPFQVCFTPTPWSFGVFLSFGAFRSLLLTTRPSIRRLFASFAGILSARKSATRAVFNGSAEPLRADISGSVRSLAVFKGWARPLRADISGSVRSLAVFKGWARPLRADISGSVRSLAVFKGWARPLRADISGSVRSLAVFKGWARPLRADISGSVKSLAVFKLSAEPVRTDFSDSARSLAVLRISQTLTCWFFLAQRGH